MGMLSINLNLSEYDENIFDIYCLVASIIVLKFLFVLLNLVLLHKLGNRDLYYLFINLKYAFSESILKIS